jgi:flagellar hook-associated protein 3 FlgL
MRVSDQNYTQAYLDTIMRNRERLARTQLQIGTGRRLTTIADDPLSTDVVLRLKPMAGKIEQYSKNVSLAQSMLDSTAASMTQMSDVLKSAEEIAQRSANATTPEDFKFLQTQIDQLLVNAVRVANTKFNGKYIFGGTQTLTQPYTLASDLSAVTQNPNGVTGTIDIAVGDGITQKTNLDANEAFQSPLLVSQGRSMFDLLLSMKSSLQANTQVSSLDLDTLNDVQNHVISQGSYVGIIQNMLKSTGTMLDQQKNQIDLMLESEQGVDIAKAITDLKQQETNLDAALNVGARIIPKTLLDFI